MNFKKMSQKQTKKILDAVANHPGKKSVENEVNLEKIAKTLTDRKFGKSKTSSDEESVEE